VSRPEPSLKARAIGFLARREHSRAELAHKLGPYAETREQIETLLDELVKQGFLSDARYAEAVARTRGARFGSQRIAYELRQKGVTESVVEKIAGQLKGADLQTARAAWQKKFGVLPSDGREKGKQVRFLQSRGFSIEVIDRVLRGIED
jgi:regulatory protein